MSCDTQETYPLQSYLVEPKQVGDVKLKYELAPPTATCPSCKAVAKRHSIRLRRIKEINLDSPCTIEVRVGVYRCRSCSHFFRLQPDCAVPRKQYSRKAIEKACLAVGADKTTFHQLGKRLDRDFHIRPATSTSYHWFHQAADKIDLVKDYETWAAASFSGALALDELYDGFAILVATDPLNDRTISVRLCRSANEQEMLQFLLHLKELGIEPQVVISDGSNLYRHIPKTVWPGVRHQLCIFHLLRNITDHVVKAISPIREAARRRDDYRSFTLLRKYRYLVVRHPRDLSQQEIELLEELCERNPGFGTVRRFMCEVYGLFAPGQRKADTLARYHALLNDSAFHLHAPRSRSGLYQALRTLKYAWFRRGFTYLDYQNCPRTNNHVERSNRYYRKRAKTHYRNRTRQAIWNMIKTDLMVRKADYGDRPPVRLLSRCC